MNPQLLPRLRQALSERFGLSCVGLSDAELRSALSSSGLGDLAEGGLESTEILERVMDHLPIDESSLFRHSPLWEWLEREALPAVVDRALEAGRPVRALSLGCAGGQEAYSLAIVLQGLLQRRGMFRSSARPLLQVLGLDASPSRVERARSGALNSWSVERASPERLEGNVLPASAGTYRVASHVRECCQFEKANLLEFVDGRRTAAGFDVVLLQHVLIYFALPTAREVLVGVSRELEPHALLVVSPSEAHLLAEVTGLEPLEFVGAARRASRPGPRALSDFLPIPTPPSPTAAPPAPPEPPAIDRVERLVAGSLELFARGLVGESLHAIRTARRLAPRQLFPKLVEAQVLLLVDAPRGRQLLRELMSEAEALPFDTSLPMASELTVGQLFDAARLLLEAPE